MMNRIDHSNVNRRRAIPYLLDIEVFDRASATSVSVGEHNCLRGGLKWWGIIEESELNARQLGYHRVYTGTIDMFRQTRASSSYEHYVH